jgi:o-succinylbenzoate synthase
MIVNGVMKIERITALPVSLPMRIPFVISAGRQDRYNGVIVKLECGDIVGWGEASPSERVTGENVESVIRTIESLGGRIVGEKICLDVIDEVFDPENPSASAAMDIALHDALGRIDDRPVYSYYGHDKDEIETSITVSVGDMEDTLAEAEKLVRSGATTIKMKIGTDEKLDIERVAALRKKFPEIGIRLDANYGYDFDAALRVATELEKYNIQFIEQPLAADDYEGHAMLQKEVKIRLMIDEGLKSMDDLEQIIETGAGSMINIKLMKVGGIRRGSEIARRAMEARFGVMVGCMIETEVSIGAGTHLCLAEKAIQYADLDGHTFLLERFAEGGVITENGRNRVAEGPGLGLTVLDDRFRMNKTP